MPKPMPANVLKQLSKLIMSPSLENSRILEQTLIDEGFKSNVFGRLNQRSSVEANSESDRGVAERLANAFDASLTAARISMGVLSSDPTLTPRNAAQRFLAPNREKCEWAPIDRDKIKFNQPMIQFWDEDPNARHRYRKYHPGDGLVGVMIRDYGLGLTRDKMASTILNLNSDDKLRTHEAIGQFGHGGSSSLSFCESALIMTMPRFGGDNLTCNWTLVYPEQDSGSKQELLRKWFCDEDGLPLILSINDIRELSNVFPGTSVWHFGYHRGGWIKRIAGPEQTNPWGRISRLFFSYPLPFDIHGVFARTDMDAGTRSITGSFYRLIDKKHDKSRLDLVLSEKEDSLFINGVSYGRFSIYVFVLVDKQQVRDYIERTHPIILTLSGQNHGELTTRIMTNAGFPELATSTIIEVRLDRLDQEALSNIISNSREMPKSSEFTRELEKRLTEMLKSDESLSELEKRRQEEKAKKSNEELNQRLQSFLSSVLSDATNDPSATSGSGTAPGPVKPNIPVNPRPEIPCSDPPKILEFISSDPFYVPEGSAYFAKFKSDARPPKYSFGGDNPRLFARVDISAEYQDRLILSGRQDINTKGYGSVALHCREDSINPIEDKTIIGTLTLLLQCTDGNVLMSKISIGVAPKPQQTQRPRKKGVSVRVTFHAPVPELYSELSELLDEKDIMPFGSGLGKFCEGLNLDNQEIAAYWGDRTHIDGVDGLGIEINAANHDLRGLLLTCRTAEEKIQAKERYLRDVLLDCYQHLFSLDDIPEEIGYPLLDVEDKHRASEIYLNHDKAIRFAIHERNKSR